MPLLTNDSDRDWERFGQTDPYFAVLTDPEYHGQLSANARATFFRSGEVHVEQLLSIVRSRLDEGFRPQRALDFGCGVGRILIPLAARCREVIGVDVSAAMLAEARRNCDGAGASHVRLVSSDDDLSAVDGKFDLVHSYIVLQHVPIERGERIVRALASRLAPGGVGIIHATYAHATGAPLLGRLLYWARTRIPAAHWTLNLALGRPLQAPLMQSNLYSVTRLLDILWQAGCEEVHVRFTNHQGNRGVLLFAHRAA
ncbi:MAG TPA: methyltransferase domain-containing protein [Gemmatimonadaceae bacterium]|nr:methyltransferase domain-containing protein [Gemmatimonadaceae bacterium]